MRRGFLIGVAALLLVGGANAGSGDLPAAIALENHALAHFGDQAVVSSDLHGAIARLKNAQTEAASAEAAGMVAKAIQLSQQTLATHKDLYLQQSILYATYAIKSNGLAAAHPFGCRGVADDPARLAVAGCSVSVSSMTVAFPHAVSSYKLTIVSAAYQDGFVIAACRKLAPARIRCAGPPVNTTAILDFTPPVKLGGKLSLSVEVRGKSYALPVVP